VTRRVIQYGKEALRLNRQEIRRAGIKTVFPDGTKCHSQEKEAKNEINVSLGLDENCEKVLLNARVKQTLGGYRKSPG